MKRRLEMASLQDCIKFAKENPICSVATMDGAQPRTRFLGLWRVDETGFYFQTETKKAFYEQLKKNPKTELSFPLFNLFKPGGENAEEADLTEIVQMRVTGEVEFLNDMELNKKCLEDRPFLKGVGIDSPDSPLLSLFRIAKGEILFWRIMDSTKEASLPRIKF